MNVVAAVAVVFTALFAFLTLYVIFERGVGVLELLGVLVVAVFGVGIVGALGSGRR
jgi:hypothetical membrane protein